MPTPTTPTTTPTTPARKAEIVSRAWAEACSMAGADPGRGHRPPGALAAAALRAHGTLSAGLGQGVPLTALGPAGGGVRGLAAFLAVYAAQQELDGSPLEVNSTLPRA
jgi:hypothetical protein